MKLPTLPFPDSVLVRYVVNGQERSAEAPPAPPPPARRGCQREGCLFVTPLTAPPGPGIRIEDVTTPLDGEPCDCHELPGGAPVSEPQVPPGSYTEDIRAGDKPRRYMNSKFAPAPRAGLVPPPPLHLGHEARSLRQLHVERVVEPVGPVGLRYRGGQLYQLLCRKRLLQLVHDTGFHLRPLRELLGESQHRLLQVVIRVARLVVVQPLDLLARQSRPLTEDLVVVYSVVALVDHAGLEVGELAQLEVEGPVTRLGEL